jgi:glycosyltransferase involved in cell wall biosynthesis
VSKPVVHLYTVCWGEEDMLGFFFRHYDPWVDRYVVYDDGSTDGSVNLLEQHPRVELRRFDRIDADSFVLSLKVMQDEAWKQSRDQADWVVITAIDEHLWVRNRTMTDYLAAQKRCGVTLIPALGFDMNNAVMPEDRGLLIEAVSRGRPRIAFNKLSIFDPAALRSTGFKPGRHAAEPVGDLRVPARDELMLWHYKHLGFARNAAREAAQARRLGRTDVAHGFGQQYLWSKQQLRRFWDEMEQQSTELGSSSFAPDRAYAGPLWWRGRADIVSAAAEAPARPSTTAPTVSVLIKSFNHAAYVRQTIESVLAQSFQDFEIVVTDDGSVDGTLQLLRGFTDPRIRLEAFERNQGISAAMNATVARARGRYLAILNSDDWALPDRLRRQVTFLDAHPDISVVFGLPRAVDEAGHPTEPFNDFKAPLAFPDFSRRSWLRHFFFYGNCLCAPTAMVRREVYEAVGPYDPRLTNLQDFDMWIRILIAGHTIHLMPEQLTAFRIRENNGNMSAPRPDSVLRGGFETIKILRRFASLDSDSFEYIFGADLSEPRGPNATVALRLASPALRDPRVIHQNFALELLYETAREPEDFRRLQLLSGTVDALGIQAVEARERQIAHSTAVVAELDANRRHLQERLADLQWRLDAIKQANELLQVQVADLLRYRDAVERSTSWRVTWPMRMIGGPLTRRLRRFFRPITNRVQSETDS